MVAIAFVGQTESRNPEASNSSVNPDILQKQHFLSLRPASDPINQISVGQCFV
jgi:hypothetical protein